MKILMVLKKSSALETIKAYVQQNNNVQNLLDAMAELGISVI